MGSSKSLTIQHPPNTHQTVGVEEDTFGELCERPAVEFGERDAQLRPRHERQVRRVSRVQHVHTDDVIKRTRQLRPGDRDIQCYTPPLR